MKILLLGAHPDARVRVRIAYRLGMLKRVDFIAELVAATGDPDGEVSAEAFRALSILDAKLSDEDRERLDEAAFSCWIASTQGCARRLRSGSKKRSTRSCNRRRNW